MAQSLKTFFGYKNQKINVEFDLIKLKFHFLIVLYIITDNSHGNNNNTIIEILPLRKKAQWNTKVIKLNKLVLALGNFIQFFTFYFL